MLVEVLVNRGSYVGVEGLTWDDETPAACQQARRSQKYMIQ